MVFLLIFLADDIYVGECMIRTASKEAYDNDVIELCKVFKVGLMHVIRSLM